jgi:hypothetical protein
MQTTAIRHRHFTTFLLVTLGRHKKKKTNAGIDWLSEDRKINTILKTAYKLRQKKSLLTSALTRVIKFREL